MGLISDIKKLFSKDEPTKTSEVKAAPSTADIDVTPDMPQPFGFKTSWLCIKSNSPEEVISKLRLMNAVPANWENGLGGAENGSFFVSPAVHGWVIVVGFPTFGWSEEEYELPALLDIAQHFSEVQAFASHRVVDLCAWAKFRDGKTVRAYYWLGEAGEVLVNEGECTPEEQQLGFDNFVSSADDDWEEKELPDEMSVCEIAAAWGVDPMFSEGEYEAGTGYLCCGTDY